jgi:rhodanese-related sulfurtransferase
LIASIHRGLAVLLWATALPASGAEQPAKLRWKIVNAEISRKFGEVPTITTAELARLLTEPGATPRPLLLDVRTRAEFKISHLAGARRVEPKSDPAALQLPAEKGTPIVTYCSVGYRSAEFARALRNAGFKNVRNLSGSIFQWANEDRPLVSDGGTVAQTVHPYSFFWGGLLKKERRANVPSAGD